MTTHIHIHVRRRGRDDVDSRPKSNFEDVGRVNHRLPSPGYRRVHEIPFPGDHHVEGVLSDLWRNNPDWKLDLGGMKTTRVPVKTLVSMQPNVSDDTVRHYRKHQDVSERGEENGPPTVIAHGGHHYIANGTHRSVASIQNGESHIEARVVKAD